MGVPNRCQRACGVANRPIELAHRTHGPLLGTVVGEVEQCAHLFAVAAGGVHRFDDLDTVAPERVGIRRRGDALQQVDRVADAMTNDAADLATR